MLSILNSPFPSNYDVKESVYIALGIGLFVGSFLIIFQPFGISEYREDRLNLKLAGFGVVSFLVVLGYYLAAPRIFKNFFAEKNYTLGKDILASAVLILFVALGNGLYAQFVLEQDVFGSFWKLIYQTLGVGIFPLTVVSLLQHSRQMKMNLRASEEINSIRDQGSVKPKKNEVPTYFLIPGEKEKKQILSENILYLESKGNYAYLNQLEDGVVLQSLHRSTLKNIEVENAFHDIIRCHRSFIVNLSQVINVSGNAQGLKLSFEHSADVVPVSKKYIPVVKKYFTEA